MPQYSVWTAKYASAYCPLPSTCGVPLKQPASRTLADMERGELVFKCGARTGPTAGRYSYVETRGKLKTYGATNSCLPFSQYIIEPCPLKMTGVESCFGNVGDSGSVVYNSSGEVLGLLRGVKSMARAGCVTAIEDMFDNIKALTGGVVTDIRISPR